MRLRRLDLVSFGLFTNKTVDFGDREKGRSDFHVIEGPNESGKTTLREGYLRLLYGFPSKDPYGFRHQQANLRVRGVLEIDGKELDVTRISKRSELLDSRGQTIPDPLPDGPLQGIGLDEYKKLLCLDDETIEAGGEEIVQSKGDIGRLLFSAVAGIGDLSDILEEVRLSAESFYLRRGSKQRFRALKRELDGLADKIKKDDVSASDYRSLRKALDDARESEEKRRAERQRAIREASRLKALIDAHPVSVELGQMESRLEPLAAYPERTDIDPKTLVDMRMKRVELVSARERVEKALARMERERSDLRRRPELVSLHAELEELEPLRERASLADLDVPELRQQCEDCRRDMNGLLAGLGVGEGGDPERHVLNEAELRKLEGALSGLLEAERVAAGAKEELREADRELREAEERHRDQATKLKSMPDLQPILDRHDAPTLIDALSRAEQDEANARQARSEALAGLHVHGISFDRVPALSLSAMEVGELARQVRQLNERVESEVENKSRADREWDQIRTRLETFETFEEMVTEEGLSASRAERDRRWQEHRQALSESTADTFEVAMKADDGQVQRHRQQVQERVELRQLKLSTAGAERERESAEERLRKATEKRERAVSRLVDALQESGFPADVSGDAFAEWARRVEGARKADAALQVSIESGRSVAKRVEALRSEIGGHLPGPHASLGALVALAGRHAADRVGVVAGVTAANEEVARDRFALERRREGLEDATNSLEQAAALWNEACAVLPEGLGEPERRQAPPLYRKLREIAQQLRSIQGRLDAMERDRTAFGERVAALAGEVSGLSADAEAKPLEAFRELRSEVGAAMAADAELRRIEAEMDASREELESAEAELEAMDRQVAVLARSFDDSIAVDTIEALQEAVENTQKAVEARESIRRSSAELTSMLDVGSVAEARAQLANTPLSEAKVELQEAESDLAQAETEFERAIKEQSRAETELDAVSGQGNVAVLLAQREALEIEMQRGMLRYLEDRIGYLLADEAIRRYRDAHRSEMIDEAERVFSMLTDGAYSRLDVRAEGGKEFLKATAGEEGAVKRVGDLSKGTRFQLYLALRAASYAHLAKGGTVLPFFCDDVFETFDENRTRAACRMMRHIGETGQAIYLTHHRHVADIAEQVCGKDVRIYRLSDL